MQPLHLASRGNSELSAPGRVLHSALVLERDFALRVEPQVPKNLGPVDLGSAGQELMVLNQSVSLEHDRPAVLWDRSWIEAAGEWLLGHYLLDPKRDQGAR